MNMYIYLFVPKKPKPQPLNLINLYQRICMSEMFYHVNGDMITSCVNLSLVVSFSIAVLLQRVTCYCHFHF